MGERNRRIIEKNPGEQQPSRVLIVPFGCTNLTVPTGSLDSDSAGYITELLIKSAHVNKRCVIAVTHSNEFADQADVLFHLKNGNLIMEKR